MAERQSWINWAGTATASPTGVVAPTSRAEISEIVRRAAADGARVKARGSGHSFTDIAAAHGTLIDLGSWRPEPVVDEDAKQVTVGAGTPLWRLNALLADAGLALPNLGDIDAQTCAGATSTGTHGTGATLGGLSTFIAGLTLVDGTGTVRRLGLGDDELAGAAVGLGALGIVTDITWQCVDAFTLVADERPLPVAEVVADFDRLAAENDHFEFYWFPRSDRALVKRNNRAGDAPRLSRFRRWLDDDFLSNTVFEAVCRLGKAIPATVPAVTAVSSRALSARRYTDASHRVFCTSRRVRFVEMEYAVPREAFADVFAAVRREADKRRIVFPVEVRVAAPDDLWLSTAHGRDTVYFAVHQYRGMPYRDYFDAVEAVMRDADGRPHWGKLHGRTAADLTDVYPDFDRFRALRDDLDPHRVFANPYLDRVLG